MNWRILLTVLIFLVSLAGLFCVVYLLVKLLERIFHIHLH
jgi:hypothetical protein